MMAQLGRFLRRSGGGYSHWCPGCSEMHAIAVERPMPKGDRWSFDGNAETPTFNPSINISAIDEEEGINERCHYFIRAGRIEFLGDCTHALKGQTVALPELPERYQDRAG